MRRRRTRIFVTYERLNENVEIIQGNSAGAYGGGGSVAKSSSSGVSADRNVGGRARSDGEEKTYDLSFSLKLIRLKSHRHFQ